MNKKIISISFLVLYAVGIVSAILVLSNSKKESSSASNSLNPLTGIVKNKDIIGLIKIDQPITFYSSERSFFIPKSTGASYWLEQMDYAATNNRVKAVIIQVNSPGGTVGASQELHAAVQRIKDAGKPVITSVSDLSASGGYYATVASDKIFVNAGSLIGSIGVILGGIEYSELLSKLGIKYQAITSGQNKDILSPYKKMTPEQQKFLQTMVNNTYEQFLTAVVNGRKKTAEEIKPLADGSIFTGEQAIANGLADNIGTFYDALMYTKNTYNLNSLELELISPENNNFNLKNLISVFAPQTPELNIINASPAFGYSPVLYLYQF